MNWQKTETEDFHKKDDAEDIEETFPLKPEFLEAFKCQKPTSGPNLLQRITQQLFPIFLNFVSKTFNFTANANFFIKDNQIDLTNNFTTAKIMIEDREETLCAILRWECNFSWSPVVVVWLCSFDMSSSDVSIIKLGWNWSEACLLLWWFYLDLEISHFLKANFQFRSILLNRNTFIFTSFVVMTLMR